MVYDPWERAYVHRPPLSVRAKRALAKHAPQALKRAKEEARAACLACLGFAAEAAPRWSRAASAAAHDLGYGLVAALGCRRPREWAWVVALPLDMAFHAAVIAAWAVSLGLAAASALAWGALALAHRRVARRLRRKGVAV